MCQRSSLRWVLSALSPVLIAKSSGRPVTGPPGSALSACTMASATCAVSISCGRYADWNGNWVANGEPGSLYRSRNSTRAGDCASMTCMSVS